MADKKNKKYKLVRSNLNSQVYEILKEMIADRRFAPGSYVNVEQLTHELGVSRTPIWEAVRRLEQEGIVVHTPHKGVRVRELTRETALELYAVREALEGMAAALGAEKADREVIARMEDCLARQERVVAADDAVAFSRSDYEFHDLIVKAGGNRLLEEMLEGLRYKALPLAFRLNPHFSFFLGIHFEILEAFRNNDPEAARRAVARHHGRMREIISTVPWGEENGAGGEIEKTA